MSATGLGRVKTAGRRIDASRFWGVGRGWDYLTEENADASIALLCEYVAEVVSLRKQAAQREMDSAPSMERPPAPAPVQTVSSFSDPFAGHAPKHIANGAPEPEPVAEVVEVAASAASADLVAECAS